jgi:GT2 family glycosyltransferase
MKKIKPTISVIIVNYNGRPLLGECLDSLREQIFKDFEVIVVDNASTDGSISFLRERYPEVALVGNTENRGYGGGNNDGIRVSRGEYIAILNNDAVVDKRWLAALVEATVRHEVCGMFASKILNYYDRSIIDNAGLLIYRDGLARGRGRLEQDIGQYDREEEVLLPSGCSCLYSKKMLEQTGLFDEDLFLYMDDVDLGLRARLAGWMCMYVPEAVVYHKYSATAEPFSPLKAFLLERNRIWVTVKYFPLRMLLMSPFYTLVRYTVQGFGALAGRGAAGRLVQSGSFLSALGIVCSAYGSACRGLAKTIGKRRRMRPLWKISAAAFSDFFTRFAISVQELSLKE